MVASEIRALFAVASRPEIVSLAGGSPFVSALPLDAVGDRSGAGYARLSYSLPDPGQITEGVQRLAGVIGSELALRQAFGSVLRHDD